MNKDKYVFAQLIEFLNNDKFRRLVDKYDGNRYVKHLTCWNQLLALMFGQLCNRESLRDVIVALEAHRSKCFHLGLGRKPIAKTTLATANQNRDYRIFEEFAFYMMTQAKEKRAFPVVYEREDVTDMHIGLSHLILWVKNVPLKDCEDERYLELVAVNHPSPYGAMSLVGYGSTQDILRRLQEDELLEVLMEKVPKLVKDIEYEESHPYG